VQPLFRIRLLPPRLDAVARLVPRGARVVDVGAGHGRLLLWLASTGRAAQCIGVERPGAEGSRLERALSGAGPEVRLGDGLAPLTAGDRPDVLVMSGLGARSMLRILEAGIERVGRLRRLVLQPQTEAGRLRRWLSRRDLTIVAERIILDRGRFYVVVAAEPVPPAVAPPPHPSLSADDLMEAGPLLVRSGNPLVMDYWRRTLARLDDALSDAADGPGPRRTAAQRARAMRILSAIEKTPAGRPIAPHLV
jgi:tRNA (adenine22-N1)-methyltransferase